MWPCGNSVETNVENLLNPTDSDPVRMKRLSTTVWIGIAGSGEAAAVVAAGGGGAAVVLHAGRSWSTRSTAYGGKEAVCAS